MILDEIKQEHDRAHSIRPDTAPPAYPYRNITYLLQRLALAEAVCEEVRRHHDTHAPYSWQDELEALKAWRAAVAAEKDGR